MKVLVVDDHEQVRKGLRQLLELKTECQIVGEGSNGAEAVGQVDELNPDVVLMDMNMPVMNGVEATRIIKERHPDVKVLALTAFGEMALVTAMVKAGASGYLLKGGSSEELIQSLNAVANGQGALDKEVTKGIMADMAELYKKEQGRVKALADLDRMKREFVAIVSHELRTPLTSIKGGVLTLQHAWNDIDDPTKQELLSSIDRQADRLTRLVGQILTVSGIQRGGIGLSETVFPLEVVASEVMQMFADRPEGHRLTLESGKAYVSGDKERLREAAASLVENALAFTEEAVMIRLENRDSEARLSVIDRGPGLSPEMVERILSDAFVQGDSSSTREVGGLGLSLYITRQVLHASGGRLEVQSTPAGGSTFTMVLPATDTPF